MKFSSRWVCKMIFFSFTNGFVTNDRRIVVFAKVGVVFAERATGSVKLTTLFSSEQFDLCFRNFFPKRVPGYSEQLRFWDPFQDLVLCRFDFTHFKTPLISLFISHLTLVSSHYLSLTLYILINLSLHLPT